MLAALAAGCHASSVVAVPSGPPRPATTTSPASTPSSPPSTPSTTATPVNLPAGVPSSYPKDAEPGDVPLIDLIPEASRLSGSWFPPTAGGRPDMILVAYSTGNDPFRQTHGLVEWVRFTARPFWRATYAIAYPPSAGVLGISVQLGNAKGDGSPDALVFASTGGSGNCGLWSVIDLAASSEVLDRTLCDATITFSTDPVGLNLAQAIFAPTDPHCCPSSTRFSVLTWSGATGTWAIASQKTVSATPPP
jgi:hypothetical protein